MLDRCNAHACVTRYAGAGLLSITMAWRLEGDQIVEVPHPQDVQMVKATANSTSPGELQPQVGD